MKSYPQKHSAFTLIELLVVIAIIGILASLLMPALSGAREAARKGKATAAVQSLGSALKAYYNEYGTWPMPDGSGTIPSSADLTAIRLQNLYLMLSGNDVYLDGNSGGNPRKITFMDFRPAEIKTVSTSLSNGVYPYSSSGSVTNFVDPWNNSYMVRLDWDGDNQTEVSYCTGGATITGGFAIWSAGPDKKVDTSETNPSSPTKTNNKDNLVSWK